MLFFVGFPMIIEKSRESAERFQKDGEERISLRENNLSVKEESVESQEKENTLVAQELEATRIRLEDREKTLEREINRIKNNRL